jgi:hypothetical protein
MESKNSIKSPQSSKKDVRETGKEKKHQSKVVWQDSPTEKHKKYRTRPLTAEEKIIHKKQNGKLSNFKLTLSLFRN